MKHSPRVHLVCNAHLDPVWQWNWEEGLTETLATFEVAVDLIDAYPEFVFNHNESVLYEWTREYRPELFARIRKAVAAGRWVISGGWYLQPDCNLPCGESFVRQALLGRRFFREAFGVEPRVAYNLDPFGHHGNLPQILRKSGYDMYVHFRPTIEELPLDDWLYRWQGIDGSVVAALRPPCHWYNTAGPAGLKPKIEAMLALARETGGDVTAFWGAGDHGGGATRDDLELIRDMAAANPEIVHSSFEAFRQTVQRELPDRPLVKGELQKCFTGCYTSVIGTKQRNRRGEGLALAAERYAALAWWVLGTPYPDERLGDIWRKVLFNQFHDILPGSSVREGYQGSAELYGHAFTQARELLLSTHLRMLQTRRRRNPLALCVFNPQAAPRRTPVELEFMGAALPTLLAGKTLRLLDTDGRPVPCQWMRATPGLGVWRKRLLFVPRLPALGFGEYRLEVVPGKDRKGRPGVAARRSPGRIRFRTRHYTLALNTRTGQIDSLRDTASGAEWLRRPGGALLVREDTPDAWGPARCPYGKVVGRFRCPPKRELAAVAGACDDPFHAAVQVIEAGPLATRVEVVQTCSRSVARLRYTLYANRPEIGVELLLNWSERRRALQFSFPTVLDGTRYLVEIPHGAIARPTGNDEEPCGRWVLLQSADRKRAFALVNDGPGGVDVSNGDLRQTVVRSPVFCTMASGAAPDRLNDHMDLGEHILRFTLRFGPAGTVRAALPVLADDLGMPPAAYVHIPLGPSPERGLRVGRDTVRVEGAGIHLAALKRSEDGRALVARLVETRGRSAQGELHVPRLRRPARLRFTPFEIKTLRITEGHRGVQWKACTLEERGVTPSNSK